MEVFLVHLGLAIILFFTVNWLGKRSASFGYMHLSVFVRSDPAPAFNFIFRVFCPVVYLFFCFRCLVFPEFRLFCCKHLSCCTLFLRDQIIVQRRYRTLGFVELEVDGPSYYSDNFIVCSLLFWGVLGLVLKIGSE